jgi:hypothetical protein
VDADDDNQLMTSTDAVRDTSKTKFFSVVTATLGVVGVSGPNGLHLSLCLPEMTLNCYYVRAYVDIRTLGRDCFHRTTLMNASIIEFINIVMYSATA